jgi:translation initiation factor IF-3
MRHVRRFLEHRDKVKITVRFRGREITHPELGRALLDRVIEEMSDIATVEAGPRMEGRQMIAILTPRSGQRAAEVAATGD